MKKLTKKQKTILLVTLFIALIIGIVVSFILFKPKENSSVVNHELTNEFDPIITKNEDGSYRIFGAEKKSNF